MEQETGNKIIAEFMQQCGLESKTVPNMGIVRNCAKYHTSWDWLMPVVEKIGADEELKRKIDLSINYFFDGDIKSVWLAVIDVISWYNNQKVK